MNPNTISTIIDRLNECDPRVGQYALDVLEGRECACEKIRLAVRRCLKDLEKEIAGTGRWRFDPEEGSKPIRFMEKFMRPSGDYDRMDLMPWQCFFEANLFGWIAKDTGERKYRKGLLLVGGGNGKTPLIAGTAIYIVSQLDIRNCNVDVFANSKDQADILIGDCEAMINASTALSANFECQVKGISFFKGGKKGRSGKGRTSRANARDSDGMIKGHASEARKLDGIRPTAALIDEKHEMRGYRVINHCVRSLNKAKEKQLMLTISTMGYVLDGPLVDDYRRGDQILKEIYPAESGERELVLIYELDADDDPEDSSVWKKANPSLGVLLNLADLIDTWEGSRLIPALKADFLTKQLNIFTSTDAASFIDFKLMEMNRDVIDTEELRGLTAYGAHDMSASEDHCSACVLIPMPDGRLFIKLMCFVPKAKSDADANRLPYPEYEKMGYLKIVPGRYVQQQDIHDWYDEQAELYGLDVIGGDPANSSLLARALQSYRGPDKPVYVWEPVRQGAITLNDPMKRLREAYLDGRIVHNRNLLFEWYVNNVRLRKDYKDGKNENWVPTKGTDGEKIDGFVAALNAFTIYLRRVEPCADVQEEDGRVEFYQLSF